MSKFWILFSIVCCTCVSGQISSTVDELKLMVQTLQQQVSAIHSTLLTQQTMSIDDVCKTITNTIAASEPEDCSAVLAAGDTKSGVYMIKPPGESVAIEAYCDMQTDGGGWTQIQKRIDGTVDFYRSYREYETGFGGNKTGEHWLGNRHIHALTNSGKHELLVELEDYQNVVKTAHYDTFSVGDSSTKYALSVGNYTGTAGDSLMFDHDGHAFSANDTDHDDSTANCAQKHHGGYWYSDCFKSNINGKWGVPGEQGIIWGSFKNWSIYVLKRTEMKIRPKK